MWIGQENHILKRILGERIHCILSKEAPRKRVNLARGAIVDEDLLALSIHFDAREPSQREQTIDDHLIHEFSLISLNTPLIFQITESSVKLVRWNSQNRKKREG